MKYTHTLGFIFNRDLSKVLLIKKNRPIWQKGKFNGLGGKLDDGEEPFSGISREVFEESGIFISKDQWRQVGVLDQAPNKVGIFAVVLKQNPSIVVTDEGLVDWYPVHNLPIKVLSNLNWLIPLCVDRLKHNQIKDFLVNY